MSLRVGMIGLTHPHSAMYLRTLESLDAVSGLVLCDPDPAARERVARECPKSEEAYADLDAVLSRPDVPVLLVTLPTNQVPEVLVRAARAGKHLICEKPCARSAEEFQPVLAALAAGRVQFTTAYL
ncbi:MAG TPA: Gfo/Idh/MocA family oxidoreductase, partial [Chloroflexota bacterium]|nr:Gfo/Idh/MocA family oxidoreductase [Chloroflexota bacterium]